MTFPVLMTLFISVLLWSVLGLAYLCIHGKVWEGCSIWNRKLIFLFVCGPAAWILAATITAMSIIEPLLELLNAATDEFLSERFPGES